MMGRKLVSFFAILFLNQPQGGPQGLTLKWQKQASLHVQGRIMSVSLEVMQY